MTQPSLRDLRRRYATVPALKCRAILRASLTGRTSDDLMIVHRTSRARLRIFHHKFWSGLENTFEHFEKHTEPERKQRVLPFLALGLLLCIEIAGSMSFADALRTNNDGQTPERGRRATQPKTICQNQSCARLDDFSRLKCEPQGSVSPPFQGLAVATRRAEGLRHRESSI